MDTHATVVGLDALAGRILAAAPAPAATSGVVIVAVDGPAGSGKTTLAGRLGHRLGSPVIHMDDIYPGWDGLAEAAHLVAGQVLAPLAEGRAARHRRWDWSDGVFAEWVDVAPAPIVLVEGCGSGSLDGAAFLAMLLWVEAPHDVRHARGIERDGEGFRPHWERWARQEDTLFAAHRTRARADVVLDAASPIPHDPCTEVVVADG